MRRIKRSEKREIDRWIERTGEEEKWRFVGELNESEVERQTETRILVKIERDSLPCHAKSFTSGSTADSYVSLSSPQLPLPGYNLSSKTQPSFQARLDEERWGWGLGSKHLFVVPRLVLLTVSLRKNILLSLIITLWLSWFWDESKWNEKKDGEKRKKKNNNNQTNWISKINGKYYLLLVYSSMLPDGTEVSK